MGNQHTYEQGRDNKDKLRESMTNHKDPIGPSWDFCSVVCFNTRCFLDCCQACSVVFSVRLFRNLVHVSSSFGFWSGYPSYIPRHVFDTLDHIGVWVRAQSRVVCGRGAPAQRYLAYMCLSLLCFPDAGINIGIVTQTCVIPPTFLAMFSTHRII